MRFQITLPDDLVRELDRRVGARGRSSFISAVVERALDDEQRWELMEVALGSIEATGHDWDVDPAAWVRAQRRSDPARVG